MSSNIEILRNLADESNIGKIILRGTCPFCEDKVTFKQISYIALSKINGYMIPVLCEGCSSIVIYSDTKKKLYPSPKIKGVEGLPEEIDKYYQEALRCISADSPNGAVTLFRKTIHAIGIHYRIAQEHDKKDLKGIIEKLEADGHITSKIRDKLLGIKDIGNDGAHINENEPDMSQALLLKSLMDSVLTLTILDDQNTTMVKNLHKPNKSN